MAIRAPDGANNMKLVFLFFVNLFAKVEKRVTKENMFGNTMCFGQNMRSPTSPTSLDNMV